MFGDCIVLLFCSMRIESKRFEMGFFKIKYEQVAFFLRSQQRSTGKLVTYYCQYWQVQEPTYTDE